MTRDLEIVQKLILTKLINVLIIIIQSNPQMQILHFSFSFLIEHPIRIINMKKRTLFTFSLTFWKMGHTLNSLAKKSRANTQLFNQTALFSVISTINCQVFNYIRNSALLISPRSI